MTTVADRFEVAAVGARHSDVAECGKRLESALAAVGAAESVGDPSLLIAALQEALRLSQLKGSLAAHVPVPVTLDASVLRDEVCESGMYSQGQVELFESLSDDDLDGFIEPDDGFWERLHLVRLDTVQRVFEAYGVPL